MITLDITLDVQRSEQPPAGYIRYIRLHSFIHNIGIRMNRKLIYAKLIQRCKC